ncbi:MAG: GAF domain-containing protein [Actinobacteria bacterium]|nr:GAF domain-containing protein [Actinomycetota bacterium]
MPVFARARAKLPKSPAKWRSGLEAALTVSDIAASAAPLPEAVQAMVQAATSMLGAEHCSIMLLEDDGVTLVLVASYGLPTEVEIGHTLRVGESIAGRVLVTGKPLLLGEVDHDAFENFVPKSRRISSSIVVPLRVHGRAIGVLSLATSAPATSFDEDDLRLGQMFADQAAALIYRAKLHEEAEHRSSDLLALVEASKGLLGALDVESLLQSVLDGGTRLAGSSEGFVALFDSDSASISRGVFRGFDKEQIRSLLDHDEVVRAIENVDIAIFRAERGLDSPTTAAVGLRTGDGTRGVLVLMADPELIDDRRHLLKAFGQQCNTAIGAAELHTEMERKESEVSSIIQSIPNPIILVDAHGKLAGINPAAEQIFGISGSFSGGTEITGALGNEEVERLLTGKGDLQTEVIAGNPARTYKARVRDVRVPGAPMGRVLVMDDVTTERDAAQTQRDFVAMIGHELRTPLTIIKGFARTMLRRIGSVSSDDIGEALRTIDGRANQLERLIEDLLYVSKIETREASLRIEQVDIQQLAATVAKDIIEDHVGREVLLDIPPGLVWACDETKVGLILRHLIDNGLKYSDAPAPVVVRASDEGDELRLDVIDKGIGIVSSDIPGIFERFRQVDGSATRSHGGTGVGLYLCAQLARMHDGEIWVDSTWGKGSSFGFSLPRRAITSDVVRITSSEDAGINRGA